MFNAAMVARGQALDPATIVYMQKLTDTSDPTLLLDIDDLIKGLKLNNLWDKIDLISVIANNASDSLIDLKDNQDATNNGLSFTAGSGFIKGGGNYITTNHTLAAMTWSNPDHHAMVYRPDSVDPVTFEIGASDTGASPAQDLTFVGTKTNLNMQSVFSAAVTESGLATDHFLMYSVTSATTAITQVGTSQTAHSALSLVYDIPATYDVLVGNYNSNGAPLSPAAEGSISAWSLGVQMSQAEMNIYKGLLDTYMTARGVI